jgi:aspartyl-tRNA(Asn)/glutamyl-tRNA(Gln) amidotransferase subunit A
VFPLAATFDSIGPLAHTVADCVLVDQALRGARHPVAASALASQTFVIDSGILADGVVTDVVRNNLLTTMDALARQGARVITRSVPAIPQTRKWIDELGWAGAAEGYRFHAERLAGPDRDLIDPRIMARLELGRSMPAEGYQRLLEIRREMQARIVDELDGAILVTPTVGHVAPELAPLDADPEMFAQVNMATLRLTMIGSFLDMPGLAMPSGTDAQGLPTSVQFSVPSGDDERLLGAGLSIDATLS